MNSPLRDFVGSCLRGELLVNDCAPVYQLAVICAVIVVAVIVLAILVRRRAGGR